MIFMLYDPGFRIQQGKDTLTGGQSLLELAPERGDTGQGTPEQADALQEEEPVSGRDTSPYALRARQIDHNHRARYSRSQSGSGRCR